MGTEECKLLGGMFSTLVQASLGAICVSALVLKRHNEVPQRDWYVWFLDVMKQAIGSGFGHFANIFLSVVIAGSLTEADECQWYCLTYVLDSTLGTLINILMLKCFEGQVQRFLPECTMMRFGDYGNPPQLCVWFPQLVVWMCIVIVAKLMTLYVLLQFINPLNYIVSRVFSVFREQPQVELVVVMIIIPTIMNTIQFWVTDTFLKKHEEDELTDSELDEELISGGGTDPDSPRYVYRAAAPMRGTAMQRTHSGSAGHGKSRTGGAFKSDGDASEGIQLSSLVGGGNTTGSYATLSSSSAHGDSEDAAISNPNYAGSSRKATGQGPRSPSRSNSSIIPSVFSGLAAFLPASLTGISAPKLGRAGSDERLESSSNPITSNSARSSDYEAALPGAKKSQAEGSIGPSPGRGDPGAGVGAAKGYYTPSAHSTVKQRTAGTVGAHGTSGSGATGTSSAVGGTSSAGTAVTGRGAGTGALRSGSLDSAEEKDMYL